MSLPGTPLPNCVSSFWHTSSSLTSDVTRTTRATVIPEKDTIAEELGILARLREESAAPSAFYRVRRSLGDIAPYRCTAAMFPCLPNSLGKP
jgi:hypothetical protein